ncbi:MAG: trypsin-like peptidase domain-containing protein [Rhodocyclaceae bacterium]|nr:trypsin-like peptidase domain-containing protein [Rhodocyclaceae bacterium]
MVCVALVASAGVHGAGLPDFTVLAKSQGASVVNIRALRDAPQGHGDAGEGGETPDFLKRLLPDSSPHALDDDPSVGSGFVIDADGYILTNAHVVDRASSVEVRLIDKRTFIARVLGADARSDVALIKIDAADLPVVRLGRAEALEVGEWVVAIGSPFGFENSVTAGIVSARGRVFPQDSYVPFIQTDVAINPGNSGGPLFNLAGEVVGVNSQIYSRNGGFMGVSFAIPIDLAMQIQRQLRAYGEVRRGRIGVGIQELTPPLAAAFGLARSEGALVGMVEPDSPAHAAGVHTGDVVLRFGDMAVHSADDLPRIVGAVAPGSRAPMTVMREGRLLDLTVTVGQWAVTRSAPVFRPPANPTPRLGLELTVPSGAQRQSLGVPWGLEVQAASGPASRAKVQVGDVLVASVRDGRQLAMRSLADIDAAIAALPPGEALIVLVQRGPSRSFVAIETAP